MLCKIQSQQRNSAWGAKYPLCFNTIDTTCDAYMAFTGSLLIIICIGTILGFNQMLIRVTVVPFASPHLT